MLKSFSFMFGGVDYTFYYDVWTEIQKLKWYFYKFAGENADEAMHKTLMHTLSHFDTNRGNLSAYIKKLAREITKDNGKLIFVNFLEQTLAYGEGDEEEKPQVDTGKVQDFSTEVIDNIILDESRRAEIINLALEFMDKFIILCEALIKHDTSTVYYPEIFISECLKLSQKCRNFNQSCIDIYLEFKEDFEWFLTLDEGNIGSWKETDYLLINQRQSKRVRLLNEDTDQEVIDADQESWYLSGNLGKGRRKRVIKVYYESEWETMCDLVDDCETNCMKFVMDDSYIVRTLGGSYSVLNPDLYNLYDLIRMEILTNVLQVTGGRVLNVGSECIYILCDSDFDCCFEQKRIRGIDIDFSAVDITDTLV